MLKLIYKDCDIYMFKKIRQYFKNRKLIKSFKYGDIIWCHIDEYGERFKFEDNHKIRPFLFVKYEKRRIYGYTLTTKKTSKNSLQCKLSSFEGSVLLMCLFELKIKQFKEYSCKMDTYDLNRISKIIYNMHDDPELKNEILKTIKIEENDIVIYKNERYLVYAKDLKRLTLYKVTKKNGDIKIIYNRKQYYVSMNPVYANVEEVVYFDKYNDDIKSLFSRLKKDKMKKKASGLNHFVKGDLYKTNKGTFLVIDTDKSFLYVTKYNNPDYVVRKTNMDYKKRIGKINEVEFSKFLKNLNDITNTFSN